jgi:hypothetical protein
MIVLTGVILFGAITVAALYLFYPQYYTPYTLFIPPYFILLAFILLCALSHFHFERVHIRRALARMMLLNASQLFTSIIVLFCYIRLVGEHKDTFVLLFGLNYIWFMALKLFVFYNMENYNKVKKLKDNELKNDTQTVQ